MQGGDKLDFLHSENMSTMYLWYCLLKCGLFDDAKTDLPDDLKADGDAPEIVGTASVSASSRRSQRSNALDSIAPLSDELGQMKEMMLKESNWQQKESKEQKHRSHLYAMMHLLRNNKKDLQFEIETINNHLIKSKESLFMTEDKLLTMNDGTSNCSEKHIKLYDDRVNSLKQTIEELEKNLSDKKKGLMGITERLASKEFVIQQLEDSIHTTESNENNVVETAAAFLNGNIDLENDSNPSSPSTPEIVRRLTKKRIRSPTNENTPTRRSPRLKFP